MHRTMPTSTAGRGAEPVHTQPRAHPRPRRAERRGRGVALAAADGAPPPRPKLAVFVSGGGSNLRALHAATAAGGRVNADIAVVVSDVPGCGGWEWAAANGITTARFPPARGEPGGPGSPQADRDAAAAALAAALREGAGVEYVALAGYLKLIPPPLVHAFPRAMLNIHPALLPGPFGGKGMYGGAVHDAVVASGARVSGATIHFVDGAFDRGPILAQAAVVVRPDDSGPSLAARVLAVEHELFPDAVGALVGGRVKWRPDGVPVMSADR